MNYYLNLHKRVEADLKSLIDPAYAAEAAAIKKTSDEFFSSFNKPKIFTNNADGFIIQQETAFEQLCAVLEDNGTQGPKRLSTYEFMARTIYCEKKFKAKQSTD